MYYYYVFYYSCCVPRLSCPLENGLPIIIWGHFCLTFPCVEEPSANEPLPRTTTWASEIHVQTHSLIPSLFTGSQSKKMSSKKLDPHCFCRQSVSPKERALITRLLLRCSDLDLVVAAAAALSAVADALLFLL
jgi:hypothetical protein